MEFNDMEIRFNNLIMEWNRKINLVSRKKENVFDLISDSRLFLDYINVDSNLLDLGTGGGFPGIVIKINKPNVNLTLVDSVKKKIDAVNDIIIMLNLNNAKAVWSRVEELYLNSNYNKSFDYIVSRSVAELPVLLKWSKNLLKPSGILLTLKGKDISDEINKAQKLNLTRSIECYEHAERLMIKCILN